MIFKYILIALKKTWITFKRNIVVIMLFALGYGLTAFFVNEQLVGGRGDVRPTVFLPSLIAIIFGPLIGGFVGGIGNLIYDIIRKIIIEGETLKLKHLVGFIANFTGAFIVGILKKDLNWTKIREKDLQEKIWIILWNTIAAMIGMGAVLGFMIGIGLYLVGDVPIDIALELILAITWVNSIWSLLLLIFQPLYLLVERHIYNNKLKEIEKMRKVEIIAKPEKAPVEIVEANYVRPGAIEKEWCILHIKIKNKLNEPMKYRIELIAPDLVEPSVKYSKKLEPGEEDILTFSVYPLDSGERSFRAYIKPWPTSLEKQKEILEKGYTFKYQMKYYARKDEPEAIRAMLSIISILMILALTIKALIGIFDPKEYLVVLTALIIFAVEIALVLIWYVVKKWRMGYK